MIAPAKNLAAALLVGAIIALSVAPFLKQNHIAPEQAAPKTPAATLMKKVPQATQLTGQGSN